MGRQNRLFMMARYRSSTVVVPVVLAVLGIIILVASRGSTRLALLGARPLLATLAVGDSFPKQLIDPAGTVQAMPAPPRRIVSAILAGDEILTALVAPDRLAGVTYLVDHLGMSNITGLVPPSIPRIHAEIETILALQPDLVVVAGYTRAETVRLLVAAGIPVVRFQWYRSFQDVMTNIRTLAAVVGAERRAAQMLDDKDYL